MFDVVLVINVNVETCVTAPDERLVLSAAETKDLDSETDCLPIRRTRDRC
jgi:hypothetical protein